MRAKRKRHKALLKARSAPGLAALPPDFDAAGRAPPAPDGVGWWQSKRLRGLPLPEREEASAGV
ncbi:MAG: hypothetical protein AB7W37_13595 [Syntrophobacteraceae bacterium]